MTTLSQRPTLSIVGPTASGKSGIAMEFARRHGHVEIISVDSMQVYRGLDIGTAKASPADRAEVPHHMIDLLDIHEECSVSWFQAGATASATEIGRRGSSVLYVGGTGLYQRAVVDGLVIPPRFPEIAERLELEPATGKLFEQLTSLDPRAAARMTDTNRRRIVRALEVTLGSGRRFSDYGDGLDTYAPSDVVQVCLTLPRDELELRIRSRWADQMAAGLLEEIADLERRDVEWSRTAAQAIGYRQLLEHVRVGTALVECEEAAIRATLRFAARQVRWFRRDPRLVMLDVGSERAARSVVDDIDDLLGRSDVERSGDAVVAS